MPARILIVEDNAANLALMSYLLEAFGHYVGRSRDGEAGLAEAASGTFDLILADILMPKMDGYEFTSRIKNDAALRSTPVVAVTALAMVGDREKVLRSGFDGYIPKPINPETFVREVDAFLAPGLQSASRPSTLPASAKSKAPTAQSGLTVMVVDDVPTNLEVVRAAIEPSGHRVVAVRSMVEASAVATKTPPDLIIADVQMPDGSGFDMIRMFKAHKDLARIPFIFLSSTYWHEADRDRGISLGAEKFLVRPIDPHVLLAEVDDTLRKHYDV